MRFIKKLEDTTTSKTPGIEYSGIEVSARDDGGGVFMYTTDITGKAASTMLEPEQAIELGVWLIAQGSRLIEVRDI